jgi:hypothetical protein
MHIVEREDRADMKSDIIIHFLSCVDFLRSVYWCLCGECLRTSIFQYKSIVKNRLCGECLRGACLCGKQSCENFERNMHIMEKENGR